MSPRDRDVHIPKHPRAQSQPGVPSFIDEEYTGKYDGDELREHRSKRPTHARLDRLETKADEAARADMLHAVALATVSSKIDTVLNFIKDDREQGHRTEQMRIGSRAKVIIGVVGAICTAAGIIVTAVLAGCL